MVAHRLPEGDFGHNPYDQVEQFVGSHLDPESGDFAGEKWGDHSNSMWIWIYLGFTAVHLDSRDDLTTGRHWMTVVINFASRIANFGCAIAKFRNPHLWWFRAWARAQWATIPTRLDDGEWFSWIIGTCFFFLVFHEQKLRMFGSCRMFTWHTYMMWSSWPGSLSFPMFPRFPLHWYWNPNGEYDTFLTWGPNPPQMDMVAKGDNACHGSGNWASRYLARSSNYVLVVGLVLFFDMLGIVIPIDFHNFSEGLKPPTSVNQERRIAENLINFGQLGGQQTWMSIFPELKETHTHINRAYF